MIELGLCKEKVIDRWLSHTSITSFREGAKSNNGSSFIAWQSAEQRADIDAYITHIFTGYVNLIYASHQIEAIQLICKANQFIGLYDRKNERKYVNINFCQGFRCHAQHT